MSISVVQNPDGTFTVTCGTTSVIVGKPSSGDRRSTSPEHPAGSSAAPEPVTYPGVTPVRGGVSIYIVTEGQHENSDPPAGVVADIDQLLLDYYRGGIVDRISPRIGQAAPGLKLRWSGKAPIEIDDVLRAVRGATGWERDDIAIHIGNDDPLS